MRTYKCLKETEWLYNDYRLIPVRSEDRESIRIWRNEQIDILRQDRILSPEDQDKYFSGVIEGLFDAYQPSQILFSILIGDSLIGYGGLVHIDWLSRNAEISFLTETNRNIGEPFKKDFSAFLEIMKNIAFGDLGFIKLHTTVYDIRPLYIQCIEEAGYVPEGRLKNHRYVRGEMHDVLIYSLFKEQTA